MPQQPSRPGAFSSDPCARCLAAPKMSQVPRRSFDGGSPRPKGAFGQAGQIFTPSTTAIFYNWCVVLGPGDRHRQTPRQLCSKPRPAAFCRCVTVWRRQWGTSGCRRARSGRGRGVRGCRQRRVTAGRQTKLAGSRGPACLGAASAAALVLLSLLVHVPAALWHAPCRCEPTLPPSHLPLPRLLPGAATGSSCPCSACLISTSYAVSLPAG